MNVASWWGGAGGERDLLGGGGDGGLVIGAVEAGSGCWAVAREAWRQTGVEERGWRSVGDGESIEWLG